jgi:hypothetical protein
MRLTAVDERKKRGCTYCVDKVVVSGRYGRGRNIECPHEECPYKVLDKYDTYDDYMESKESEIVSLI